MVKPIYFKVNKIFYYFKGYDPRNCPDWYKEELDRFMAENPELELEEAADPKRLVNYFSLLVFGWSWQKSSCRRNWKNQAGSNKRHVDGFLKSAFIFTSLWVSSKIILTKET